MKGIALILSVAAVALSAPQLKKPVPKVTVRQPTLSQTGSGPISIDHGYPAAFGFASSSVAVDCGTAGVVALTYTSPNTGKATLTAGESCVATGDTPATGTSIALSAGEACGREEDTSTSSFVWTVLLQEELTKDDVSFTTNSRIRVSCKVTVGGEEIAAPPYNPNDDGNLGTANVPVEATINFGLTGRTEGNQWIFSFAANPLSSAPFTIQQCVATAVGAPEVPPKVLVSDGCVPDALTTVNRVAGTSSSFTITAYAFRFASAPNAAVQVSCTPRACLPDDEACINSCPAPGSGETTVEGDRRAKRSIIMYN